MTITINGTNGLIQAYDYQVLTTGFSYTFAAGTQVLVINPAGTLATGTVTMPASPSDGMTISVESTQQVTALTMSGNGNTLVGSAVQLIPNQPLSWVYRSANSTWYPFRGGAGRATALVSGTSQASTSGTAITFTGIPSWVKRITVLFNGVSTSSTSLIQVQIGAGSVTTSGYSSNAQSSGANQSLTSGFVVDTTGGAASVRGGALRITNITGNTWVADGTVGVIGTFTASCVGYIALGGTLDRVVVTTNGADTFDAGSINILYE
jgi:hypothetical protein